MQRFLPLRGAQPPDDAIVVIRGGVLSPPGVERAAMRSLWLFGVLGISVEGAVGVSVPLQRAPRSLWPRAAVQFWSPAHRWFRLAGDLYYPHFTVVLSDLSDLTLARLVRCFDDPVPNPAQPAGRKLVMATAELDLEVDFMDMTSDRRLWARAEDGRPGFVPVAGRHVTVGCEDAEPAVARVLSVNAEATHVPRHTGGRPRRSRSGHC